MSVPDPRDSGIRHLVLIPGDQLDLDSAALDGFDASCDLAFMIDVPHESTKVWSHQARTACFLAAVRHFARALKTRGIPCEYSQLGTHPHRTLEEALRAAIKRHQPRNLVLVEPGGPWQVWSPEFTE